MRQSELDDRQSRWRISLRDLFLWLTLIASAIWVISWEWWDTDERILLGAWFCAVAAAIVHGRQRGGRGIWWSTIAGGVAPALAGLVYYLLPNPPSIALVGRDTYLIGNSLFTLVVGAVTGGGLAALLTPRIRTDIPPSHREDRARRRLRLGVVCAVTFVLSMGAVSIYRRATAWTCRGGFWTGVNGNLSTFEMAVSTDGTRLATIEWPHGRGRPLGDANLKVWSLTNPGQSPLWQRTVRCTRFLEFSPDGEKLAVALSGDHCEIAILNAAAGDTAQSLAVPPDAIAGSAYGVFTADGTRFVLGFKASDGDSITSTFCTYRTNDWKVDREDTYEGSWAIHADGNRLWLSDYVAQFKDDRKAGYRLDIAEFETSFKPARVLYSYHFRDNEFRLLSPTGRQVVEGKKLVDLATGNETELRAIRDAFTRAAFISAGRRIVVVERWQPQDDRPRRLAESIFALPLVRHAWFQYIHARIVVIDANTGRRIRHSQWLNSAFLDELDIAADGKTAVARHIQDYLTIWEIPD